MSLRINSDFNGVTDPDALAYVSAVEAADGQLLEFAVGKAINDFVVGCKVDGNWNAIKAGCILSGARKKEGAFIDLRTTTQVLTNNGFADGDYNRKTGLVGNGSTKYLNSNRANNADPQNSSHNACWVSAPAVGVLMASSSSNTGQNYMDTNTTTNTRFANRDALSAPAVAATTAAGLYGHSRSNSSQISYRCPQGNGTSFSASQTPESRNVFLYTRSNEGLSFSQWSAARLAFYSIGEAIDLAKLDARVTALINAFGAAIP